MSDNKNTRFTDRIRIDPKQKQWIRDNLPDFKTDSGRLDFIINAYKAMKWYLLKSNKCPKCGSYLTGKEGALLLNCSNPSCDFKIGTEKFAELSNTYVQRYNRRDKFQDPSGWSKFQDEEVSQNDDKDYWE